MGKFNKPSFLYFLYSSVLNVKTRMKLLFFEFSFRLACHFPHWEWEKRYCPDLGRCGGRSNKHHGHLPISPLGMGKKDCDLGFDLMILGPLGPDSALMGRPGLAIFPIRNGENATAWIWGDVGSVAISIMETCRFAHWAWGKGAI